ncbi:hypothetical protein [Saliphagus sp. LR7]|uniref:hypothetical protein n=1 Tax=Saliphagus sp. LR7 TaxID=2282654 RepID=UPI000DF76467|nr:hypothetical protein [Saliphagus sp. LR7]
MASGHLTLFTPGSTVDVVVEVASDGTVATDGDLVEIVGQSRGRVHVAATSEAGASVGHLDGYPDDYDENATYESGDVLGESSVLLRKYVDWLPAAEDTLAPGDLVVDAAGGVRAYDSAGGDTPELVMGRVWTPHGNASGTADKVAVARRR